ncbi:T9SS type A sorting domain-containing protein [Spirosoma areae]
MKTLVKSLALALSLGFATTSATFADVNPIGRPATVSTFKTGIYSTVSGKLAIALDKTTGGTVDIRLKDASGKVLYSQHLGKKDQMTRVRLNLSDLEDGVYSLEITNGVDTTTHNVTIATNQPATPNRIVALN